MKKNQILQLVSFLNLLIIMKKIKTFLFLAVFYLVLLMSLLKPHH